ncbi:uncharacterized protein LOC8280362 [Ricinus communis]|uniref:Cupin type-1 domain-containing protein n=1 Tax=Ricinus communis TaxID=3988 RepID=B9SN09_RICCO|nr:uncharacterized protein LOC8280362 [Ricinus communis]EEF35003.1 conserved hypothetical protein [Ricinus communis]|eukprot:XP_002527378.1 uncharacterized protein LOC8280362 [Ricinus communis]
MANPRRSSYSNSSENPFQVQNLSRLSSLKHFLKKPHAFPFLLSIFLFLTWLSLKLQHRNASNFASSSSSSFNLHQQTKSTKVDDKNANLIRFKSDFFASPIIKDKRGWLLDPVSLALDSGITGGAVSCASLHVGEIRPGTVRGNHRHYTCNETFVIWGAKTLFRLENGQIVDKGYAEVVIGADEVAIAASPSGTAHLLVNLDPILSTFFIGCQDNLMNYNDSTTDFNVWKDF